MQTIINVEQLSKSYGNLLAVDKICLSVKRGTVYRLLGANGARKRYLRHKKCRQRKRYQSWGMTRKKQT
ncbi:hypothetical protein AALB16_08690 [Lachnospiraceae bacterium 62-35]